MKKTCSKAFVFVALISACSPAPTSALRDAAARTAPKIVVPDGYDGTKSLPVVLMLHGLHTPATWQDAYFGLSYRVATRGDFILVMPEGTRMTDGSLFWHATPVCCDFEHSGIDDAGYLKDLIRDVRRDYNVDEERVVAIGHSNGGFMANRLACEADSPISAFASLAGSTFTDPTMCHAGRDISSLQIHAVDDGTVAYAGSPNAYPAAPTTQAEWAARQGCDPIPVEGETLNLTLSLYGDDAMRSRWENCASGSRVELWTIRAANPLEALMHEAHAPLLGFDFTDQVLDYLLGEKSK